MGKGRAPANLSAKPEERDESNGIFDGSATQGSASWAPSISVVTPEENKHWGGATGR